MSWEFKFFRSFFRRWFAIFLTTVGLSAAIFALIPISLGFYWGLLYIFASMLVSAFITKFTTPHIHFPTDDVIPFDLNKRKVASIHFPCDSQLVKQANLLAQQSYGHDNVSSDLYEQWRGRNSLILTCLLDRKNNFVGYFDIIPLRASFISRFVAGTATEKHITVDDIIPEEKMQDAKHLYFAGISVNNPLTISGKRHAAILIWASLSYIKQFYLHGDTKRMHAVAATEDGRKLLQRIGFKLESPAASREDGHDMYVINISEKHLKSFEKSFWKIEQCCDFSSYDRYFEKLDCQHKELKNKHTIL